MPIFWSKMAHFKVYENVFFFSFTVNTLYRDLSCVKLFVNLSVLLTTQLTLTCSKLTIEAPEVCVKYVQS